MTDVASLLTVQELDNGAGALRHRLATLPERAALAAAQALVQRLDGELAERDAPRHALELRQRKLEGDAIGLRAATLPAASWIDSNSGCSEPSLLLISLLFSSLILHRIIYF